MSYAYFFDGALSSSTGIRDHEDCDSNFQQLLLLRTNDSADMKNWLRKKTTWTSHDVQVEILIIMCDTVVRKLLSEIRERKWYGIIAYETADVSQVEQ